MRHFVVEALLCAAVLAASLGSAGFARLQTPFDRVHAVAFVNWATVVPISVAAFVADGASNRAWKLLLVAVVAVLAGAATSHATGRALATRQATGS